MARDMTHNFKQSLWFSNNFLPDKGQMCNWGPTTALRWPTSADRVKSNWLCCFWAIEHFLFLRALHVNRCQPDVQGRSWDIFANPLSSLVLLDTAWWFHPWGYISLLIHHGWKSPSMYFDWLLGLAAHVKEGWSVHSCYTGLSHCYWRIHYYLIQGKWLGFQYWNSTCTVSSMLPFLHLVDRGHMPLCTVYSMLPLCCVQM